jgi:hypothetical protein
MDPSNEKVLDYYLLPTIDVGDRSLLRLAEFNGVSLDAYRFETLDPLFYLSGRHSLRAAA